MDRVDGGSGASVACPPTVGAGEAMGRFEDRVVIVAGAGSGLGAATKGRVSAVFSREIAQKILGKRYRKV